MRAIPILLASLWLPLAPAFGAANRVLHQPLGDPERRDREAPLVLDAITDARSGDTLTPEELVKRLAGVRLLLVGELHTSAEVHRMQLRVIEALHEAGRQVRIGLEMYPADDQERLDQWTAGLLTEPGFLRLSRWYDRWGYHWNYYRDIFMFAQRHGLGLHGLNVPRDVISAVGRSGLAGLDPEDRNALPERIDTESAEHLTLFKSYFDEGDIHAVMSDEQWQRMLEAQCSWDAAMGHNALGVIGRHPDRPDPVLVVLVGAGHLAYGLGIQRQIADRVPGKIASLIPVAVEDEDGEPIETVRASYADYLWGLPAERDPVYPVLGLSTKAPEGEEGPLKVIWVEEDSPAGAAGFKMGDVLVAFDGAPLPDKESLHRAMAGKRWGDAATLGVRRGGEELTLRVLLRRSRDEGE